jgi:amino acid transporter, AAT family
MRQGRPLEEMKFRASWTWPWGPPFVVRLMTSFLCTTVSDIPDADNFSYNHNFEYVSHSASPITACSPRAVRLAAVQGWSSIIPRFSAVDFVLFYIELPVMLILYVLWILIRRIKQLRPNSLELPSDDTAAAKWPRLLQHLDIVDVGCIDLRRDEHDDAASQKDHGDEDERQTREESKWGWAWRIYYSIA